MLEPATRVANLYESTIRGITVHALSRGAINLGQGSPDFDPPEALLEAAIAALRGGWNQYVPTWGLPELRRAISNKTERFYGFTPDPDTEVTVTCGVTEAVISALVGGGGPWRQGGDSRARPTRTTTRASCLQVRRPCGCPSARPIFASTRTNCARPLRRRASRR